MKISNRIARPQPDYLFMIVRRPPGWEPKSPADVPPDGNVEVLSLDYVASYDEAREDVLRCNRIALKQHLEKWAVVQSAGCQL